MDPEVGQRWRAALGPGAALRGLARALGLGEAAPVRGQPPPAAAPVVGQAAPAQEVPPPPALADVIWGLFGPLARSGRQLRQQTEEDDGCHEEQPKTYVVG